MIKEKIMKDLVSRWFVLGMQEDEQLREFILKGGSCLNICYFEYYENYYRFSADLDFTILQKKLEPTQIIRKLKKVCLFVEKNMQQQAIKFKKPYRDKKSTKNYLKIIIPYTLAEFPIETYKLKIEGSNLEPVIDPGFSQEIIIPVTRYKPRIKCYSLEEIFSEMLRALVERNIEYNKCRKEHLLKKLTKNIYDLARFRESYGGYLELKKLQGIVRKKFKHKGLKFPELLETMNLPAELFLTTSWEELFMNTRRGEDSIRAFDHWKGFTQEKKENHKEECIEYFKNDCMKKINFIVKCFLEINSMNFIPYYNCFNCLMSDVSS